MLLSTHKQIYTAKKFLLAMATPSSEDKGNIPESLIFNGKNWVNPPSGSTSTSGTQFNTQELNER